MDLIKDIMFHMYEYQKRNNIIKCCVDNSIFLFDMLNMLGIESKVKACLMTTFEDGKLEVWGGHLVVDLGNENLLDPSYETNFKENQHYFDNLKALLEYNPVLKGQMEFIKTIMGKFVEFSKVADIVNKERRSLLYNKDSYYYRQANYVKTKLPFISFKSPKTKGW